MALSDIAEIPEVLTYVGRTTNITDPEEELLSQLKAPIERRVRDYLGSSITQEAVQTVFIPESHPLDDLYGGPGKVYGPGPAIVRLPDWPIRSITSVHEDRGGYSGQGTNAFASNTELTQGTDYTFDEPVDGFCESGELLRIGNTWPATARSIKVVFQAGWTAAELCGDVTVPQLDASAVKQAVLAEFGDLWACILKVQHSVGDGAGAAGPIDSERLGDYSVSYADAMSGMQEYEQLRGPAKLGPNAARWLSRWGNRGKVWVA